MLTDLLLHLFFFFSNVDTAERDQIHQSTVSARLISHPQIDTVLKCVTTTHLNPKTGCFHCTGLVLVHFQSFCCLQMCRLSVSSAEDGLKSSSELSKFTVQGPVSVLGVLQSRHPTHAGHGEKMCWYFSSVSADSHPPALRVHISKTFLSSLWSRAYNTNEEHGWKTVSKP